MRNKAIDIEKGLGIILVVLGHNWVIGQKSEELFRIIYSFHVPLFFFLSGVLFRSDTKFFDMISLKWQSILKPYFVVLLGVALYVGISERIFPFDNLIGILFATGQSILWTPMWFLPHLFVTVIFSSLLISYFKLRYKVSLAYVIIIILLMAGVWAMTVFHSLSLNSLTLSADRTTNLIGLPFSIDLIFISSAYFIFGNMLSNFIRHYQFNYLYFIFALSLFISSHYLFNETMNLNARTYGDLILSTMQAICGIYLVVVISEIIKNIRKLEVLLAYIGSGSLFVLIFHGVLQGKAISIFLRLFPNYELIGGLFGLSAGILCSLLLWETVKRFPIASTLLLPQPKEVAA